MKKHQGLIALLIRASFLFGITDLFAADAIATSYPPIVQGTIQSVSGQSLAIDAAGNRYIIGTFAGTLDFNPVSGVDSKTSAGGNDLFVTRFNANGAYAWTQTFGGTLDESAQGIAISGDGNTVYVTGYFNSTDAKIGGAGTAVATTGGYDAFVIALNASTGAAVTTFGLSATGIQKFGGTLDDLAHGIAVSGTTLYITGQFASANAQNGAAGPMVASTGASDAFVLALSAATGAALTNFGLASSGIQKFGGTSDDIGYGITAGAANLYISGTFASTAAQIGGAGVTVATSGGNDAFIIAIDKTTGAAVTAFGLASSGIQTFGGTLDDKAFGMALTASALYVTGYVSSAGARIGAAGPSVNSAGNADAFILALNPATGAALTTFGLSSSGIQLFGGSGSDIGYSVAVGGPTLYMTGSFSSADAKAGAAGTSVATSGGMDAFVLAVDASNGAPKTTFGLNGTGVQIFGGSADDSGYSLALKDAEIYIAGSVLSTNAGVGGPGAYSATGFGGFLLPLDATSGAFSPVPPALASATWTAPPPASLTVGQSFQVAFTTTGTLEHVNIHVDPNDPTTLVESQAVAGSTRNVTASPTPSPFTLTAPSTNPDGTPISVPTIVKYAVHAASAVNSAFSAVVSVTINPPAQPPPANQAPAFNSPPTATPNPAVVNQVVTFMAAATDLDGDVLTYAWSIDDGFQGAGAVITHAFTASGNYTATVTVMDGRGASAMSSVALFVGDPADMVPMPPSVSMQGTSVTVTPATAGQTATGYRIHYNPTTDALRQYYKDSTAFSATGGGPITFNVSQLSNFSGGQVVATAFNQNGESHYSATSAPAAQIPATAIRYSELQNILTAQCCCRARCQAHSAAPGGVAARFKSVVHGDITTQALGAVVDPLQLTSIITNDIAVDVIFLTSTQYHFDAGNVDGSIANIQTQLAAAQSSPLTSSVSFGVACHPLQDFYAHSNFVENWLAANADRAATITDAQLYNEVPALTGGDPSLMGKYHSGYYEGVTLLGGFGGTGGYSTYDLPAQVFVTIYNDLETGEARPNGYKVGFVPWHGIINKDNEVQREGMSLIAGQSMTLFAWAKRFATVHTRKVYDQLNQATKDALAGAPPAAPPLLDQINTLIAGTGTPGQNIVGFGQSTSALLKKSTHFGLPVLSSLSISLSRPAAGVPIKGDLVAQGFLAVDVSTLGTLNNAILGGTFTRSRNATGSGTIGTIKMSGVSSFYFTNISPILLLPGKGKPPFNISIRPAKIQVTGTVDGTGAFTGNASIQVKGGKGAKTEKLYFAVQAKVSP